jgi:16S rRNA U516 pseudouridylate synthase RsuA-like enzyme
MSAGVRAENRELLPAKRAAVWGLGQKNGWLLVLLDRGKSRQIRTIR